MDARRIFSDPTLNLRRAECVRVAGRSQWTECDPPILETTQLYVNGRAMKLEGTLFTYW